MVAPKRLLDHDGKLRIRFSHKGTRFSLSNLGDYTDVVARNHAETIRLKIATDISSGHFDCSNNGELALKYNPAAITEHISRARKGIEESLEEIQSSQSKKKELTLIGKLEKRLEEKYHSSDKALIPLLQKYKKSIESVEEARDFIDWIRKTRKVKNSTLQRYLNTLKVISPFFRDIKVPSDPQPLPKPFSSNEVRLICNWFENHQYYSHYADYVKFLFWTGTRTSEAIGLQWKHIDFDRKKMYTYETLGRDRESTSRRTRRSTKNRKLREFPLSHSLLELLESRYSSSHKNSSDLVFPSPKGKPIDDHTFWKERRML